MIKNPLWLKVLLDNYKVGVAAFGYCDTPPNRADGYCFLIDKELYQRHLLDESYQWAWGITKLQAQLLKDGYDVVAIDGHDKYIFHYGGKSGSDWKNARGMATELNTILKWFESGNKVKVLDFGFKVIKNGNIMKRSIKMAFSIMRTLIAKLKFIF